MSGITGRAGVAAFACALALSCGGPQDQNSGASSPPRSVAAPAPPALKPGDLAPNFALTGSDGQVYELADYRGRQTVVLAWFAKAFTGG